MSWLTIESDPAVFSSLISDLGVKDVLVEELLSIDAESINAIRPLYGIIFLFKYQSATGESDANLDRDAPVWFAQQIIQNACGTQALLAILLNQSNLDLGSELSTFRDFTQQFPAQLRGESMTNSDLLRNVHNSFSRSEMFHMESTSEDAGEAPHHFIAYSAIHGRLYELDGLQEAAIDHGPVLENVGLQLQQILQDRIARYDANELHFNLLALTKDPLANDGADMTSDEISHEHERREMRRREIELRRHNFAAAIVEIAKAAFRTTSLRKVETLISNGKDKSKHRLEKQS